MDPVESAPAASEKPTEAIPSSSTGPVEGGRFEGNYEMEPIMIVLTGLPGSGKSKFCYDLFEDEESDKNCTWVHVNQDDLGSRKRCEEVAREALISGHRVIVDRCNQSIEQRKTWIDLAKEHWAFRDTTPAANVFCVNIDTPADVCIERCKQDSHPIPSAEAEKVVTCQARDWEQPSLKEGFCAIVDLHSGDATFAKELISKLAQPLSIVHKTQE